jgi:hypothetical protein
LFVNDLPQGTNRRPVNGKGPGNWGYLANRVPREGEAKVPLVRAGKELVPVGKPLTEGRSTMDYELSLLVRASNNVDIMFLNGEYHVQVIEHSGKEHKFKGADLPWLIHKIHDELMF